MKKIHQKKSTMVPQLTSGKLIRLAIFVVLTATGFVLSNNGHISSFGWGYTFGLAGMAVLIG
ncbi:hypothetical protein KAS42_00545 [bacterium]|nr:hypothetical protein [bacterium]